jgi:hypothetical protein
MTKPITYKGAGAIARSGGPNGHSAVVFEGLNNPSLAEIMAALKIQMSQQDLFVFGREEEDLWSLAFSRYYAKESGRVFVLVEENECGKGSMWECLLVAAHHRLDNLVLIVAWKGEYQINDIVPLLKFGSIAEQIGWYALPEKNIIVDGHSVEKLVEALKKPTQGRPRMILARV